jgi:hypothetical protein
LAADGDAVGPSRNGLVGRQTSIKPQDQHAQARVVLNILNRWDQRLQGHHQEKRGSQRAQYVAAMRLYRRPAQDVDGDAEPPFNVWSRNVSVTGVSFVHRGPIEPRRCVLCMDPGSGAKLWFHVEIVRKRLVHDGFWEYGARFLRRASREEVLRDGTSCAEKDAHHDERP